MRADTHLLYSILIEEQKGTTSSASTLSAEGADNSVGEDMFLRKLSCCGETMSVQTSSESSHLFTQLKTSVELFRLVSTDRGLNGVLIVCKDAGPVRASFFFTLLHNSFDQCPL